MPKQRDRSSDEWYRGKIRALQQENRALKKRITQLERSAHMFSDLKILTEEAETNDTKPIKESKDLCPTCKEGVITKVLELQDKNIYSCDTCHYRKVEKQDG